MLTLVNDKMMRLFIRVVVPSLFVVDGKTWYGKVELCLQVSIPDLRAPKYERTRLWEFIF